MSSTGFSHYKVLEVPKTAAAHEIRAAYRKKALEVHPDKCHGSEDSFLKIQEAYDVLGDPVKRAEYDAANRVQRKKLVGFKRPPPLDDVVAPVTFFLADQKPYVFETAPAVLRSGVAHGDLIGYGEQTGSFIGLAGDHHWWWCKSGDDYPTRLCDPRSDMTRSSMKVLARGHYTATRASAPVCKPAVKTSSGSESVSSEAQRQAKKAELEKMRQAILSEGRQRVKDNGLENLLREEHRLRVSRETFLMEALYLAHQRYNSLKLRLAVNAAPSFGEWEAMFTEARKPLAPFYPNEKKPSSASPKASASPLPSPKNARHADPLDSGPQSPSSTLSTSADKKFVKCSPTESAPKSAGKAQTAATTKKKLVTRKA